MRVIVDCHGADAGVSVAVDGALAALEESKELKVVLCGIKDAVNAALEGKQYDKSRLTVIEAQSEITNNDEPVAAVRRKKDSSMVTALRAVANNEADAIVSAGNTGALLAGASLVIGRIRGIKRVTLASVVPTINDDHTIIVDSGANVDCTSDMLMSFALMGSVYMNNFYGKKSPRVGLLNNGAEEEKGNALTKETHALLKQSNLNFIGNVEARDILTGKADVIVADGFAGNVAIKASEGMASAMMKLIKNGVYAGGLKAKIGALLLKGVFKGVKKKMSADEVGGGVFLGAKNIVIKTHGSSTAVSFQKSILNAERLAGMDVVGQIEKGLSE